MAPPFKLTLEMEDQNIVYKQQGFRFYKVSDFEGWVLGTHSHYTTTYSSPYIIATNAIISQIGNINSTVESEPTQETPTNTEEFIQARQSGRTVSNFIRNLMPESITRGRR